MTLVDRLSSCILAWRVDWERSEPLLWAMVDEAPQAKFYYSDLFAAYRNLVDAAGRYTPMPDKSETYRVEGTNAEFRHCLARVVSSIATTTPSILFPSVNSLTHLPGHPQHDESVLF